MNFVSSLEALKPFKMGRWQLREDKNSESVPKSQTTKVPRPLFKPVPPVPCDTCVLISAGSTRVGGKLCTSTKPTPTLFLGGLGLRCEGEEEERRNMKKLRDLSGEAA